MGDNSLKLLGQGKASFGTFNVMVNIYQLQKSYLILVTDQEEFGIGTVTLSSPPMLEGTGTMSSPFPIFGLKNNLLANMVTKITCQKLNQPVLSLLYIKETNLKPDLIMKVAMEAVLNAVDEALKQKH